jgi:O-antigen/teichoic acid export membrane protein
MFSKLKSNQGFMRYFKNTSWLFAEKILRMVVGLFVGIWVARYLGPEQFGLFSYAQAFVGLFTAIAGLGLDGIIVRELVKDPSKQAVLLGTAFYLKLIGALLVLLALAGAVTLSHQDSLTTWLIFIIASATVFQSFNVVDFFFQAKVLSKYVVYVNIISLLISSFVKIGLILTNASLIAFAWVILFDSVILMLGFVYYFQRHAKLNIKRLKFSKATAINLLKDSWPLILSGLVISIYMKVDQIMIKEILDAEAVGQYAAAVRLSEAWYFIPMVIASSLFPAIINAKKVSEEFYYAQLQKLYDLVVWIAIAIALPMTFLSDWVIDLLYGVQYDQSGAILMIHIWAAVFVFLGVVSSRWFIVENLQKYSFYRTLAGVLINIMLNYILIPSYGIYGAAYATLASQAVASYLFNITNKKLRYTFLLQTKAILLPFRKLGGKFWMKI